VQRPFASRRALVARPGRAQRFIHSRRTRHCSRRAGSSTAVQVPYETHVAVGDRAPRDLRSGRKLTAITSCSAPRAVIADTLLEDSVTSRVLERTSVPVEMIAGAAVSKPERYGVPIGIGAGIGLCCWCSIEPPGGGANAVSFRAAGEESRPVGTLRSLASG